MTTTTKKMLLHDKYNNEIVTQNCKKVIFANCNFEGNPPVSVIDEIIKIYNESKINNPIDLIIAGGLIDTYLLNCEDILQDDREILTESLYDYFNSL